MASMTPDEIRAVLDAHAKWLPGGGERANLREADLRGANLRGANLIWADLRGTGVCRIYDSGYEATLYPGTDGPELAYGCDRHSLSHWEENVEQIASKHLPTEAVAAKVEKLRALFAYLRTIPQPKFSRR